MYDLTELINSIYRLVRRYMSNVFLDVFVTFDVFSSLATATYLFLDEINLLYPSMPKRLIFLGQVDMSSGKVECIWVI